MKSREMLEIAVEHSITIRDYAAFERYMSQLNTYYYDYDKYLESSKHMHKFMGLNLLYMLATNRIADFHIELERLPSALLLHDNFINPVLALENYYMEGRYNKILQAKKSMPSEIYSNFMDMLVNTAREGRLRKPHIQSVHQLQWKSPGFSSISDPSQGSRAQSGSVETLKKIINKLYSKHRSVVRYKYVFK